MNILTRRGRGTAQRWRARASGAALLQLAPRALSKFRALQRTPSTPSGSPSPYGGGFS